MQFIKKKKQDTRNKIQKHGFTLLETLVALAVFSLAVWGPVNLALYSMRVSHYARNQVIAFYLAQEAIEYVRNVRDTNALRGEEWFNEKNPMPKIKQCIDTYPAGGCCIDVYSDEIKNWSDPQCGKIQFDNTSKRYNYDTGPDTPFSRHVWIETPFNTHDYEAQITVEMSWDDIFFTKSFLIQEHVFDWK